MTARVFAKKAGSVEAKGVHPKASVPTVLTIVRGSSGLSQGETATHRKTVLGNNGIGSTVRKVAAGPIGPEGVFTPRAVLNAQDKGTRGLVGSGRAKA